jgi:hypothetical protein
MNYLKLFEDFNQDEITSEERLKNKLKEYNIPVDLWGTGNAKTIRHLYKEIIENESTLEEESGSLVRYIEFVGIRIYYRDEEDQLWALKEDRQEFKDGRVRRRNMMSSVSEKMKFGEDPLESAIRGIEEELGVKISKDQLIKRRDLDYNAGSSSYPGLKTIYKGHQYTCYLNKEQFDQKGYIEVQEDKSTFFVWQKSE